MIISVDGEKVFYKIQHAFMIKKKKLSTKYRGNVFNIIKATYDKPTGKITLKIVKS